jgi:hypothetical protein
MGLLAIHLWKSNLSDLKKKIAARVCGLFSPPAVFQYLMPVMGVFLARLTDALCQEWLLFISQHFLQGRK